ncbi:DUF3883 domain-containing protein [Sedimentibacter saalensis]|uniref:Uncharacterized protein DUF3883 n=1 Tax=Sedimentibacter saalensis TaxID=130788 RepID=A0A562JHA7_9FIRM|nr:DUF3883 domain-containing protein [Sedimentibacter saalensis]TWH82560.1 uncharacterized protein DUF3883 [Sedimentibacter saalensis]
MEKEFQKHIASFEESMLMEAEKENEIEKLRIRFITNYTKDAICKMDIDDYITGKGNKNTFCYRIEFELKDLGNIKGGFATKFGVYYGVDGEKTESKYRYLDKFGSTLTEAFETLKNEIINLIEAGSIKDFDKINSNLISPMLKGKILYLYYPNDFLNIYSSNHLDYFMNQLNIGHTKRLTEIDKQKTILEYKNNDDIMKSWSIKKFGKFLYYLFGSPTNKNVNGVINLEQNKMRVEVFTPIQEVNYQIIDLKTKALPTSSTTGAKKGNSKVDFEEKNKYNKRIGDRGELIVLKAEEDKLKKYKKELVKKIKHISIENDSAGYDILSFDEYGNEIYIEVKSTTAKPGDANFYLTSNELERAKGDMNYWIYIVFEVNTDAPKIWKINNPFEKNKDEIKLIPLSYNVKICVE